MDNEGFFFKFITLLVDVTGTLGQFKEQLKSVEKRLDVLEAGDKEEIERKRRRSDTLHGQFWGILLDLLKMGVIAVIGFIAGRVHWP